MAFPETRLPVEVALQLGGTWTDITADVYSRDEVKIRRGRSAEGKQVDAGECELTLNNRDGKYSPRNPLSPYYGLIGRNTPIRVAVYEGASYLETTGTNQFDTGASTPDAASLDITGDIDIRIDATLDTWITEGYVNGIVLCGKGQITGDQQSWLLLMVDGRMWFEWSTSGASTLAWACTADLPLPASGRLALRITLDVDNGAGGSTLTFYTAPTINEPWTQLGEPRVATGTTSIFNSTAPVRVGDGWGDVSFHSPLGQVHAFELRDGIDGTVVANPDFTTQTPGATSFLDDAGNTWSVDAETTITNRQVRFHGEVSSWPARWGTGGFDVWVPIEAGGIRRRLGQGAKALESTLRRRIPSYSPVAYWPMEESENAVQVSSPIAGVPSFTPTDFDFGSDDTLPASNPLPTVGNSARFAATVPAATPGEWQMECVYFLETMPSTESTLFDVYTTGTARRVRVRVATGTVRLLGYDAEGVELFNSFVIAPEFNNAWNRLQIRAEPTGSDVEYSVRWLVIGGTGFSIGQTITSSAGYVTQIRSTFPNLEGFKFGHLAVFDTKSDTPFNGADRSFASETAGERMQRLAEEENVPLQVLPGYTTEQEQVGPQRPDTLLTLLQDAADADGGILGESRDSTALAYRDRASMYNQTPAMVLDYTGDDGLVAPLDPVDDDQQVRNDIIVKREGGSSGRAVLTEGALSTASPPDGVGRYDESVTLNLYTDAQTEQAAGWLLHLGTWDEARYPQVTVNLAGAPSSIGAATSVDLGDRIQITNPPAWLPPDTIDLLVQGYTETLTQHTWTITYNCAPARPWDVAYVGSDTTGGLAREAVWADTAGSELAEALTTTETSVDVATTVGPLWVTANPSLTVNSGFETDLAGWFGSGGTITRVETPGPHPFCGQWSLKFVPDGVAEFPNAGSDAVPVVVGQQYVASGWLRSATTRTVGLNTNWFTTGEVYLSTDSNDVAVQAGVWTWFEATVTAPATAEFANLAATVADFPPQTDVLWAEDLTFRPAGGSPFDFPFRITTGGEEMTVNACTPNTADTFTRTVVDGWGTPDTGASWDNVGGVASDYSVNGTAGLITLQADPGSIRFQQILQTFTDAEILVSITPDQVATGAAFLPAVLLRGAGGYYRCRLVLAPDQTVSLQLVHTVTVVGATAATPYTYAAGTKLWLRVRIVGQRVWGRVWPDTTGVEPSIWHLDRTVVTDPIDAGTVGVTASAFGSNTNVTPSFAFDDFEIVNPQTFTVDRSVNGIVKTHTAGTDVRLTHPPIIGL